MVVLTNNFKKVILEIVKDNDNESKIMLHVPHRYDSSDNSYVNKEIKGFNSKLKKTAKLFTQVTILEFSSHSNFSLSTFSFEWIWKRAVS
jgi:GTPase SAR1 family protein